MDDVWGDGSDSDLDQLEMDRERTHRGNKLYNAAYRESIDSGKEKSVQLGFDIGFNEGGVAGLQYGILRGASKTLAVYMKDKLSKEELEKLEAAVSLDSKSVMISLCKALSSKPFPEATGAPTAKNPEEALEAARKLCERSTPSSTTKASPLDVDVERCSLSGLSLSERPPNLNATTTKGDHEVVDSELTGSKPVHPNLVDSEPSVSDTHAASTSVDIHQRGCRVLGNCDSVPFPWNGTASDILKLNMDLEKTRILSEAAGVVKGTVGATGSTEGNQDPGEEGRGGCLLPTEQQ